MDSQQVWLCVVLWFLGLLFLWLSLWARGRERLLRDMPTSKAKGVFIGLVELKGKARSQAPLTTYLSDRQVVHYSWDVSEHWSRTVTETYTDSKGKTQTRTRHESGWKSVASGGETCPVFLVEDDTGAIQVRPKGASIEPLSLFSRECTRADPLYYGKGPEHAVANSDHRRRFTEEGLPLDCDLFVVGQAREREDVVAAEIAEAKEAPLFLISTKSEEKVRSGYAVGSWICWVLALAGGAAGGGILAPLLPEGTLPTPGQAITACAIAGGLLILGLWGLCWVWSMFNALVGLRQRVRQGWSLIDVQLKRRSDLIPGLVSILGAQKEHEARLQEELAALRAQAQATRPGLAGPDPEGLVPGLRVVLERYPQLGAQPAFLKLHQELVETEQRIALAREYYNTIATHFATRLERIPDGWVARLGGFKPEPLLAAAHFERAAVAVSFDTAKPEQA